MALYSRRLGSGPPVVLMHGLFGAGNNLGALARHLQNDYAAWMLDLPSHGRSDWLADADLNTMVSQVLAWMNEQELEDAHLLGHSLGGKVAMQIAMTYPDRVRSLVVADIAPVAYPHRHQAVFTALKAVAESACESRESAQTIMEQHLQEPDTIQFLLTSLQRTPQGAYDWRFDRVGLENAYDQFIGAVAAEAVYEGPCLFIKGALSDYIQEAHWPDIQLRFPKADIRVLADCGHWLHAQKPALFNATVSRFLAKVEAAS